MTRLGLIIAWLLCAVSCETAQAGYPRLAKGSHYPRLATQGTYTPPVQSPAQTPHTTGHWRRGLFRNVWVQDEASGRVPAAKEPPGLFYGGAPSYSTTCRT
jgi:hypothetical protein